MAANPWPSSDWVAALSERGVPAVLALVGAVVWLLGGALAVRYDTVQSTSSRLASATGAAVLCVSVLEGGFDAVLLLAAPALIVWALAGALLPFRREVYAATFSRSGRLAAMLVLGVFGAGVLLTSAGRIGAMRLYDAGTVAALENAVARDPGSFRIRMRLAEAYSARNSCVKARSQAAVAHNQFPNAPAPKRLLERCR